MASAAPTSKPSSASRGPATPSCCRTSRSGGGSSTFTFRRAARTVSRHIRRRARESAPREDFLQSLLPLVERVGVDRGLSGVDGAGRHVGLPGITAASLLYAMHRFPHWHARIREETSALSLEQLYALPIKSLPCTSRFVRKLCGCGRDCSPCIVPPRTISTSRGSHPWGIRAVVLLPASFAGVLAEPGQLRSGSLVARARQAQQGRLCPVRILIACLHRQRGRPCPAVLRVGDPRFRVVGAGGASTWMQLEGFAIPVDFIGTLTPRRA